VGGCLDIVDVFTGRYQATHIPSRGRFTATALHATIFYRFLQYHLLTYKAIT
jgi:hypothetical protein